LQEVFTLRPFKPGDLEAVMHINQTCLPENYSRFFFLELHRNFPSTFIVAEEKNKIVGYIMCRMETGLPNLSFFGITRKGHVVSIAVLPEHRRRGIGYALKAKECYLEVRVSNGPAIKLYKKLGFHVVKTIPSYYIDGEDAYLMARRLPFP